MNISFQNPAYLVLLFIIPVLVFFHFFGLRNLRGRAVRFANYEAIARIRGIDLYSRNLLNLLFNIAIVVSLVFSLAGLTLHIPMKAASFSYVIAIDSSQSMGANDINPTRIAAAKESAKEFVDALPTGTKVGITSFASNTFIESKMTENKGALKSSIDDIDLTNIGGTDIYEVYRTSSTLLEKELNKAIVILSDGQINIGNLDEVEYEAMKDEVVIHTIGIGTVAGGNTSFGISKLDEESLKSLAYSTKGQYFNAQDKEAMKESFNKIIPLTDKITAIDMSFYLIILTVIFFILLQVSNEMTKVSI